MTYVSKFRRPVAPERSGMRDAEFRIPSSVPFRFVGDISGPGRQEFRTFASTVGDRNIARLMTGFPRLFTRRRDRGS